nr:7-deoxyloganetic acid glucosyltransferase-like [Ipomoea batatas]
METFLRRRDLPAFCRSGDITDPKFKLYAAEGKGLLNSRSYADGVLARASEQRTEILVGFSARTLLNGESLEMCAERAVAYFKDNTVPQLDSEKNINGLSSSSSTSLLDSSWSVNNLTNVRNWEGIICNRDGSVSELNLPHGNIRSEMENEDAKLNPAAGGFVDSSGTGNTHPWPEQEKPLAPD